jgi:hypothetical protein
MFCFRKSSANVVDLYFLADDSSPWWVKGTKAKLLVISIPWRLTKHRLFCCLVCLLIVGNVGILRCVNFNVLQPYINPECRVMVFMVKVARA